MKTDRDILRRIVMDRDWVPVENGSEVLGKDGAVLGSFLNSILCIWMDSDGLENMELILLHVVLHFWVFGFSVVQVLLTLISNLDIAGSPLQPKVKMNRKQQSACNWYYVQTKVVVKSNIGQQDFFVQMILLGFILPFLAVMCGVP